MLECLKCNQIKQPTEFHVGSRNTKRGGRQTYCKTCMREYGQKWGITHKENQRASYERNKSKPENKLKCLLKVQHIDRIDLDFNWAWDKLQNQNFKCELPVS